MDEIEVNATVEQKSFFAQLFGIDQITVPATASANCFPPNEIDKVLPIAWTCKPPDVGTPSDSEDCQIQSLDWPTEMEPLLNGPYPVDIDGEPYPIIAEPNTYRKKWIFPGKPPLRSHGY